MSPLDGLLRRCEDEQNILFEVVEARIVCDEKTKKFVLYTLAVKRLANESSAGIFVREFSYRRGIVENEFQGVRDTLTFCFVYGGSSEILVHCRPEHLGRNSSEIGEIERRYSDFLTLYSTLRHDFPQLLANIPFPKKALMGNFTTEVIEARCHGFA